MGLLVFVALLPQFTDTRAAWPVAVQMTLLGASMIAIGLLLLGERLTA